MWGIAEGSARPDTVAHVGSQVVLTRGQIAGLAAMRASARAFKVGESLTAEVGTIEVEVEDGRRWLIDVDGRAVKLATL